MECKFTNHANIFWIPSRIFSLNSQVIEQWEEGRSFSYMLYKNNEAETFEMLRICSEFDRRWDFFQAVYLMPLYILKRKHLSV